MYRLDARNHLPDTIPVNWLGVEMMERQWIRRLSRLGYLLGAGVTLLAAAADDELGGLASPSGQSGQARTDCAMQAEPAAPETAATQDTSTKPADKVDKTDAKTGGAAQPHRQSFPDFVPWGN